MGRKVLVIDEDDSYREGVATQLRDVGYEVIGTGSSVNGLLKALFELPDLILMDLKLSEINGIQAILWLKEAPRTKDIPIIIYTSSHEEDQRQEALRVGAAIVLTKPGSRVILRMLIQKLSQPESQWESYRPGKNGQTRRLGTDRVSLLT
jgi:twitching motility two-component system response regulator PilH